MCLIIPVISGCIDASADKMQDVIYYKKDINGGLDSNTVAVSPNDTTPNYLENKITPGSNITVTTINEGGNEQLQISASASATDTNCSNNPICVISGIINTALDATFGNATFNGTISANDFNQGILDHNNSFSCSAGEAIQTIGNTTVCIAVGGGGSGTNYTSGTPDTIQVDDDTNEISQNFEGNFMYWLNQMRPIDYDINVENKPYIPTENDIDNNATEIAIQYDTNAETACNDGEILLGDGSCTIYSPGGTGRTYTSGTPESIEVNNDTNQILVDFDGNFNELLASNLPLDYTANVTGKPYIPTESDIDNNSTQITNQIIDSLLPLPDVNISNSDRYKQDASCDKNSTCTFEGAIDTNQTIDINGEVYLDKNAHISENIGVGFEGTSQKTLLWTDGTNFHLDINKGNLLINMATGQGIGFPNEGTQIGQPGAGIGSIYTAARYVLRLGCDAFAFAVDGFGDTGVQFNCTSYGINYRMFGTEVAHFGMFGVRQGIFWLLPRATNPTPDTNQANGSMFTKQNSDGEFLYQDTYNGYVQAGTHQSNDAPDFNLLGGSIRQSVSVTNDVNANRFNGTPLGVFAGNGVSCTSQCNNADGFPTGYDYSCLAGLITTTGSNAGCASSIGARSCICESV